MSAYDVAIIGAGPAGMAAAVEASRAGFSVVVFDEQDAPGGQIYRAIERADAGRLALMGEDYARGRALAEAFRTSSAVYMPGTIVWNVDASLRINYSGATGSGEVTAGSVIIATGAMERATPLPGWTLPGVMTAGALKILLKAHELVSDDTVLVGCGPLLFLVAQQMTEAGSPPRAVVETTAPGALRRALPHLFGALRAPAYLRKGLAMIRQLARAGVPVYRHAQAVAIEGREAAEAVSFTIKGQRHRISAGTVGLHQGVIPNQQITRLLGCEQDWSASQRCFVPRLDPFGETRIQNVYVAGDGAGIGGAVSAALGGRLAALRIAARAGKATTGEARSVMARLARDRAIRPFLEALYAPSDEVLVPADDTLVCRCEEVTAGQIREAVALGAPGPNQAKAFLRCGMGPCQGRICGPVVTEVIAAARRTPQDAVGYYRIRPPLKPLSVAEIAGLAPAAEGQPLD